MSAGHRTRVLTEAQDLLFVHVWANATFWVLAMFFSQPHRVLNSAHQSVKRTQLPSLLPLIITETAPDISPGVGGVSIGLHIGLAPATLALSQAVSWRITGG